MINEHISEFMLYVKQIEGGYGIEISQGNVLPIKFAEQIATFHPGWEPKFIYLGFAPVFLLEIRNVNGLESTWYLDENMNFLVADEPDQLASPFGDYLRLKATTVIAKIWDSLAEAATPKLEKEAKSFFILNEQTRLDLLEYIDFENSFMLSYVDLSVPKNQKEFLICDGKNFIQIQPDNFIEFLKSDLQEIFSQAPNKNFLAWKNFIDKYDIYTDFSLCFDDFRFAYRFSYNGIVFYLLASLHYCQTLGIYFPKEKRIFYFGETKLNEITACYGDRFDIFFMNHICKYGQMIESYLAASKRQLSIFTRFTHIGHDLRNELTGLDAFVNSTPVALIPEVIVYRASVGSELYGKTEEIFPQLRGKTKHNITDARTLSSYIYQENRCIMHVTGHYVRSRLRERILYVNLDDRIPASEVDRLADIKRKGYPIVLIGLRVENRTVVGLADFCLHVVQFILSRAPGCAIVIDGHSALNPECGDSVFASYQEELAETSPINIEKQIVKILKNTFIRENIYIIDNIGSSMRQCIFWCYHANFFIAISGSGLAKYRWVCNIPGLIITTREGLKTNGEIRIYESQVMESSSHLRFIEPEFVEDMPDAPTLVPLPSDQPTEWNCNFRVREDGVWVHLEAMLENYTQSGDPIIGTDAP